MQTKKPIPSAFDVFLCLLFIGMWLIPLAYMGLVNKPFPYMPRGLVHLHNASALFTHSVSYWPQYYVQLQFEPDGPWVLFDVSRDFRMPSFGYRTRLHRFFEIFRADFGFHGRAEFAAWVRKRYGELYPSKPLPLAVRFVTAKNALKKEGFPGHWRDKPFESFSPRDLFVTSTHPFAE